MNAPEVVPAISFSFAIVERCAADPSGGGSPYGSDERLGDRVSPDGAGRYVLIVEDDRDCRESLGLLLRSSGCTVKSAQNGRQALDLLRDAPLPAVILLDNLMPLMTGEEFLEERKNDPRLAGIPVLMLSAWGASTTGKVLDVAEHVRKPYDPDRVVSLVHHFLEL